jgi:phage baseplate assembly protein gpV
MLRALGATKRFIAESLLVEAGILAFIGAAVGLFLAVLAIYLFRRLIMTSLGVPFLLPSPGSLALQIGAGLVLATVSVGGTVYDSSHSTLSSVEMDWWSWSEGDQRWYGDTMTSGVDGAYSASPRATDNGEIWAYPDGDTRWGRTGQAWTAGNSYTVDLYPGRVTVSATRGGPANTFSHLAVDFWGEQAYSYDSKETVDSTTSPATVQVEALDGSYTGGSVNFWLDEGVEFSDALTVASGATPSGTISVSEVGAQRVQFLAQSVNAVRLLVAQLDRIAHVGGARGVSSSRAKN